MRLLPRPPCAPAGPGAGCNGYKSIAVDARTCRRGQQHKQARTRGVGGIYSKRMCPITFTVEVASRISEFSVVFHAHLRE